MSKEEKVELIDAVISVLRFSPTFTKRDEKRVKKIFKKLEVEDLTYLANIFDELYEYLKNTLESEKR
ncbi:MAG: hypothetical protein DRJ38_06560 [Thermoprotei archaeon]|nr:MAG: hypothetical protein DRJ38_06560 [Thermoprotei archaeon]